MWYTKQLNHLSIMTTIQKTFASQVTNQIKQWFNTHPVAANSMLCLKIWIAGDLLAQYSEKQTQAFEWDKERTLKCASFGAIVSGPLLAKWYPMLDRKARKYELAKRWGVWATPLFKVAADQFVLDPIGIGVYFGYMHVFENHGSIDVPQLQSTFKSQFVPTWIVSCLTWPLVTLGTFRYLPVYAHAPVVNLSCIVWDGYLSHVNAKKNNEAEVVKESVPEKNQSVNQIPNLSFVGGKSL